MKNKMLAAILLAFSIATQPAWSHTETGLSEVAKAWLEERRIIVFTGQNAYPPFEFIDPASREYSGLNIELIRWIATELGFTAVFTPMTLAEAQNAVLDGHADAITGISGSPGHEARFDLSSGMFPIPASIFTRKELIDVHTLRDLEGKRIAIARGEYTIEYLESAGLHLDFVYTDDFRSALALVIAGKADATIGDERMILGYMAEMQLGGLVRKASEPLYVGQVYLAVAKGDSILMSILDAGIQRARETGTLDTIYRKWTGSSLARGAMDEKNIRAIGLFVTLAVALGTGMLVLAYLVKQKIRAMIQDARADLEAVVVSLREDNEHLAASNARLRRDVEERSRLEEEKRRIDAEVAARRVEELTRCAIAAALESTQGGKEKSP
jgi:ABC-type amino acid transport substrate-binding protein